MISKRNAVMEACCMKQDPKHPDVQGMFPACLNMMPIVFDCSGCYTGLFQLDQCDTVSIPEAAGFLLLCPQKAAVGAIQEKIEQESDPDYRTDQRLDQGGEIEWIFSQI